ncbi:MAG: thiamine-phosphate kinase [Planctomycetota bacterium]
MELSFLAYLRGRCRSLPQVAVGIGDDAAVIDPVAGQQIACADQIIDGVDFLADQHDLADIGYKSMAINLSDIAAMGGEPTAALVTLSLPKQDATRIAGAVYEGILEAASLFGVAIAGGDLSTYDGPLAISVTLLGTVPSGGAWLRSGARNGDAILLSGPVGGSLLGRHLRPHPRIDLARQLRQRTHVSAAIDISDGLSIDLDRLCAASQLGAELSTEKIPIHAYAIARAKQTGELAFRHAWSDGEDFELITTMSQKDADKILAEPIPELPHQPVQIGTIVSRTGLWKVEGSKRIRMPPQGFIHDAD